MNVATCLVITAVVWSISLIRSVRLRALIYSLPLPMTTVLAFGSSNVDGAQLVGMFLLNAFFAVVALLHLRLRWPILLADAAGVACYIGVAALTAEIDWPYVATLAAVLALWLTATILLPPSRERVMASPSTMPKAAKLVVVFTSSAVAVGLGGLLGGFVVTFPYSGILVAVETRRELAEFARRFARNSIGMVMFLVAYHFSTGSVAGRLAWSWVAFAACMAVLQTLPLATRDAATGSLLIRDGPQKPPLASQCSKSAPSP
jgi:hypothetical protein